MKTSSQRPPLHQERSLQAPYDVPYSITWAFRRDAAPGFRAQSHPYPFRLRFIAQQQTGDVNLGRRPGYREADTRSGTACLNSAV